jgi:hypothetical protein
LIKEAPILEMVDEIPPDAVSVEAKKRPDACVDLRGGHVLSGRKGRRKWCSTAQQAVARAALRAAAERQGAGDVACWFS